MTQDRSFTFTIDRRSNLDTMGAMAAGTALARQLDEVVIPEVDAYRFAKMALSAGHVEMGTVTGETAYEAFLDANSALTNANVPIVGRCAAVTPDFYKKVKLDKSFMMAGDVAQAMEEAMAFCRRDDIPAPMECLVARLATERLAGKDGASRVKLGDTEIEYAVGTEHSVWNAMKKFRKL